MTHRRQNRLASSAIMLAVFIAGCFFIERSDTARAEEAKSQADGKLKLTLRQREKTEAQNSPYRVVTHQETWDLSKTAFVVCDMWDLHHCLNATRRGGEMAFRMNRVLSTVRERGATIIHAPSNCMKAYNNHPARMHALNTPRSENLPKEIGKWCYRIDAEHEDAYPIDQSDGGEDDDALEHSQWAAKLKAMDRNPRAPWKSQTARLTIENSDFISDNGEEIWSIMEQRGIENVVLLGVHTNMCVLGRPFGLRQMSKNGKNVVLMRDLTDTMYNPARKPYVSHFTGTDLIVEYIEKFVCPTVTSADVLGGRPFRFRNDKRPHVVIVSAEREYKTEQTLPVFARKHLGKDFRVSYVFGNPKERNDLPGIEVLKDADLLLLSVRRRALPKKQLNIIRRYVNSGKPIVGIRTAGHAFALRKGPPPEGHAMWRRFDSDVLGGNYHGHHGNEFLPTVSVASGEEKHPILAGVKLNGFKTSGSLYQVSPLKESTTPLLTAAIENVPAEPVAWTNVGQNGVRVFYTSLGHPDDFQSPAFNRLLKNAVYWAVGVETTENVLAGF